MQDIELGNGATLQDLFPYDDFAAEIEDLGEFCIVEALLDATAGRIRLSPIKGWHAYNGKQWVAVPDGAMLWAIRNVVVEFARGAAESERRHLINLTASKYAQESAAVQSAHKFIALFEELRQRANELEFIQRVFLLMHETLDFHITHAAITHETPPEDLP